MPAAAWATGDRDVSKFDYAQYVAASLAYLMLHQRDAVGLAIHDHAVRAAGAAAVAFQAFAARC